MNQPRQEQVKKFWEWCGFTSYYEVVSDEARDGGIIAWIQPPDSEKTIAYYGLTLDFLFKYAVPKLGFVQIHKNPYDIDWHATVCLEDDVSKATFRTNPDPALALFWAMWKVIQEAKE